MGSSTSPYTEHPTCVVGSSKFHSIAAARLGNRSSHSHGVSVCWGLHKLLPPQVSISYHDSFIPGVYTQPRLQFHQRSPDSSLCQASAILHDSRISSKLLSRGRLWYIDRLSCQHKMQPWHVLYPSFCVLTLKKSSKIISTQCWSFSESQLISYPPLINIDYTSKEES